MKRFEALYGEKPKYFCRAPGRVNIIGEHIDYCGYSVLPAALD
jgi:galactokinase